jgi:hypothetical protein
MAEIIRGRTDKNERNATDTVAFQVLANSALKDGAFAHTTTR